MTSEGFKRHGSNSYVAEFAENEREILINLAEQIIELLAERVDHGHEDPLAAMVGITTHDAPPEDEVLHRLLPNAYQDQVDSAEFRRYTESTLRNKKQAHAMAMRMYLKSAKDGTVDLDHDSANAWLGAVNDIRLALGVRLNVQERTSDELELLAPDDPLRGVYIVYGWLGWLQEGLLAALMDESQDTSLMSLTISRAFVDAIIEQSRAEYPDECCGVILGPIGKGSPERLKPMINAAHSPTFYEFDPKDLLALYREVDDNDEEIVVIYHSHTETEAFPSRTDIAYAGEPGAHYVLVSSRKEIAPAIEFRSYRIIDGVVTEEEVSITE